MKTAQEILRKNNFHRSPNSYYCCFDGKYYPQLERWSNQFTEPILEDGKRYEGIEATNFGFSIIFDHGKLCMFSTLNFPKYATEDNFEGAFSRLIDYLKHNYKWEAGINHGYID